MASASDIYLAVMKPEREDHGVKGMRWGVRKPRGSGPGPASKAKPPAKSGKKFPKGARKPLNKMSEQELTKAIRRMQLEQQYRQLTAPKPGAKDVVKAELKKIAKQQAINIGSRAATIAVAKAFGFAANKTPNPAVAAILMQLGGAKGKKKK